MVDQRVIARLDARRRAVGVMFVALRL